jgi:hypothetical protein
MNRKLNAVLAAIVAWCLSGAPALSRDLGSNARTIAARESVAGGLGSWDAGREPAKAGNKPANMGDIDNHAIDIYETRMRSALTITDPPRRDAAVTKARQQLAQNIGKPLPAGTVVELDGLLDLGAVSAQLGATD